MPQLRRKQCQTTEQAWNVLQLCTACAPLPHSRHVLCMHKRGAAGLMQSDLPLVPPATAPPCSRFLQGPDTDPEHVRKLRESVQNGTCVTVRLLNCECKAAQGTVQGGERAHAGCGTAEPARTVHSPASCPRYANFAEPACLLRCPPPARPPAALLCASDADRKDGTPFWNLLTSECRRRRHWGSAARRAGCRAGAGLPPGGDTCSACSVQCAAWPCLVHGSPCLLDLSQPAVAHARLCACAHWSHSDACQG